MKFTIKHNAWLLPALAAALLGNPNANAASLLVTNFGDSGPGTLRNQIAAASSGDEIYFNTPGTVVLNSELTISNKGLSIINIVTNLVRISGNNTSRVFNLSSSNGVVLENLAITDGRVVGTNGAFGHNGENVYGGGILVGNNESVLVLSCLLSNNVAVGGQPGAGANGGNAYGGAIGNLGSMHLYNSLVVSNDSFGGSGGMTGGGGQAWGGAIYTEGSIIVFETTLFANVATGGPGGGGLGSGAGGAIYNVGDLQIITCTIVSNSAAGPAPIRGGPSRTTVRRRSKTAQL